MITNREYFPKEKAIYQAVIALFEEGADISNLTVAEITRKAGIGKGTAYEYFSGKEEMIAKAFFYNGELFCRQLYEGICGEKNLYDKINHVLLAMERQVAKTDCIFRLIHMLSENSAISRCIKELIEQEKAFGDMAADVVRNVLADELDGRQMPSEEILSYLVLSIYSKIFCYGLTLKDKRYKEAGQRVMLRGLICNGVCREVEEIMEGQESLNKAKTLQ